MPSRAVRTLVPLCLSLFWAGCALVKPEPAPRASLINPDEERYWELTEKVSRQEAEIARLSAKIDGLKAAKAERPLVKAKKAKPKKVAPQVFTTDEDPLAPPEDSTVVDSRHETMHPYFTGLSQLEEGKYDLAATSFREFLKQNPSHIYADRAEYQIAEAHFLNKEYGLAIVATNLLESKYPYSFRLPEALYKRAMSYQNMGQAESARDTLRALLKKYPQSSVAELASQKLGELPGAPPLLQ